MTTSASRRIATAATDGVCRVVGRRRAVRAARFVLGRARLDPPNDPRVNGEICLQRWLFHLSAPGERVRVIDVGANVGTWSASMLAAAGRAGRLADLDLHAFEPASDTFARLSRALAGAAVTAHRAALSDRCGSAALHVTAPGAGTNSLHAPPAAAGGAAGQAAVTEVVATITLDAYAERAWLPELALVKIDTEGHEMAVLHGASTLLRQQRIRIVQFEYNHRWIQARAFLRDAFELFGHAGYSLGKLTRRGVEFYPAWDPDLETYIEGNYLACSAGAAAGLPSVTWWKSGR